jgi:hypothetical protein
MWIIIDRLADVILSYVEGCIVEIGLGNSTKILAKHAKNLGIKHYAVDKNGGKCRRIRRDPEIQHDGLIVYKGKSLDFIKEFNDIPALVFIDGCHDAEVVIQEAMFFLSKMAPGGIMFLHDTYLAEEWEQRLVGGGRFADTYRARWELENLKNVWCFTFPYTAKATGLTMVMKRPEYEYTVDPLDLVGDYRGPRMSGCRMWGPSGKNKDEVEI